MDTGVSLCPLSTLIEAIQIQRISKGQKIIGYADTFLLLRDAERKHPRKVNFHVDRAGRPAFLALAGAVQL